MSAPSSSALNPRAFRPTWEVGASLGIHALLAAALFIGEYMTRPDSKPLIDPSQVMMVSAVALPKQTTRMPQRATHTPDPPQVKAPTPEASPTPPPPPTASDMVLHKDDAPKPPSQPEEAPDRTDDREAALREMMKQQALKDMSTAVGDVDRPRTDPNGVDPQDAIFGSGIGKMDKEAAQWWGKARPLIWANWTPLPSTVSAHPEYATQVKVKIAADGTLSEPEVYKGTGDSSYDRSAVLAVIKTARVPPPPEKFAEAWASQGTVLIFPAKER